MPELNFIPHPFLTTARLTLRPLKPKDAPEIFALRSDGRVNQFLDRPSAKTMDDARQFIAKITTAVASNGSFYWAITLPHDDKLIGTICYWNFSPERDEAEIGYELHPDFQGQGIMQEAIVPVIAFAFGPMNLTTITAFPHTDNLKSRQLLERNNFSIHPNQEILREENDDLANITVYVLKKA